MLAPFESKQKKLSWWHQNKQFSKKKGKIMECMLYELHYQMVMAFHILMIFINQMKI